MLAIAAVYARSSVKYAGRARRYVHLEAGHAAANVALQTDDLGLVTVMVGAFSDAHVQGVLHMPAEIEPLLLLPVGAPAGG